MESNIQRQAILDRIRSHFFVHGGMPGMIEGQESFCYEGRLNGKRTACSIGIFDDSRKLAHEYGGVEEMLENTLYSVFESYDNSEPSAVEAFSSSDMAFLIDVQQVHDEACRAAVEGYGAPTQKNMPMFVEMFRAELRDRVNRLAAKHCLS